MSKIDDVRNYTYRQIQFLIRQKETSVGKAMLANLRRGIGKTGSFANVGVGENNAVSGRIKCVQHFEKSHNTANIAKQSICFAVDTFRCICCKADGFCIL